MKDPYLKFNNLFKKEKFNEALERFSEIEMKYPPTSCVLVKKGMAILLGEGDGTMQLEDVEQAYRDAITLDDEYIEAYLELGFFYLNIQDDAESARPFFVKALELCKKMAVQGVSGLAHCIEELESSTNALQFLDENATIELDEESISKTISDIKRLMPDENE